MNNNTLETKASVKNGVSRMVFAVLSILLEVGVILFLIFWAGKAAGWIYTVLRILAWILVLAIYGSHKTASIRMTWMYVIMMLPIFGTALYFLIGLNGHTLKMRKRYEDVDKVLLPMLPSNEDVAENAAKKDGRLGGLVNYIRKQAGYLTTARKGSRHRREILPRPRSSFSWNTTRSKTRSAGMRCGTSWPRE